MNVEQLKAEQRGESYTNLIPVAIAALIMMVLVYAFDSSNQSTVVEQLPTTAVSVIATN